MTDDAKKNAPVVGGSGIYCRRIERARAVDEHLACPYCFGAAREIADADHARFCDFEPGEDPIHFGFPWT